MSQSTDQDISSPPLTFTPPMSSQQFSQQTMCANTQPVLSPVPQPVSPTASHGSNATERYSQSPKVMVGGENSAPSPSPPLEVLPLEMPPLEIPHSVGEPSVLRQMIVKYGEIPSADVMREEQAPPPLTWAGQNVLEFLAQGRKSVDDLIKRDIPAGKRQRTASQTAESQNRCYKLCEKLRSGSS